MKPMISPWTIYFASRADAVGTLFLIVAVAAFAICLIGFDDLTKKAAKFTEKTIEKSSELVDTAKTKVSIKSAEADLDDQFIELGKLYYEVLNKDNVFDEKAAPVVQKIDEINQRIENLKSSLEKE